MVLYDNQRIKIVFDFLKNNGHIHNQQHFADKIGYGKSNVSLVLNGKIPASNDLFNSISTAFPILNREWLLTGEGEMLSKQPSREEEPSMARVLEELAAQRSTLLAMLAEKDRHISQLLAMLNDKK